MVDRRDLGVIRAQMLPRDGQDPAIERLGLLEAAHVLVEHSRRVEDRGHIEVVRTKGPFRRPQRAAQQGLRLAVATHVAVEPSQPRPGLDTDPSRGRAPPRATEELCGAAVRLQRIVVSPLPLLRGRQLVQEVGEVHGAVALRPLEQ